jgi:hypothetical protein
MVRGVQPFQRDMQARDQIGTRRGGRLKTRNQRSGGMGDFG